MGLCLVGYQIEQVLLKMTTKVIKSNGGMVGGVVLLQTSIRSFSSILL
jgi:vacuolar-type H+-ATPase subunit I/STV1